MGSRGCTQDVDFYAGDSKQVRPRPRSANLGGYREMRRRNSIGKPNLGPGEYNPNPSSTSLESSTIAYSISKVPTRRFPEVEILSKLKCNVPPPGSYDLLEPQIEDRRGKRAHSARLMRDRVSISVQRPSTAKLLEG